jgi:predicted GTPase
MKYGAGRFAASAHSATPVDPRPYLTGSIKQVFEKFPHLGHLVPAMGYWPEQLKDLEETIEKTECEAVVVATPMDLRRLIRIGKPCVVASYEINDRVGGGRLGDEVVRVLGGEVKVDGK